MDLFDAHRLPMVTSRRPHEAGRQISRFFLNNTIIEAPERQSFKARVGGINFGALSILLVDTEKETHLEALANSNSFLVFSGLKGTADIDIDGNSVHLAAGTGFIARPCQYLRGNFSKNNARLLMKIDATRFEDLGYRNTECFELISQAMEPWLHQVQMLLSSPTIMRAVVNDRRISESMERLIIELLQHGRLLLPSASADVSIVSRDVRRAEAFMRAHSDHDITLKDIANAAGASARSLQNNFRRFRGVTPTQYLRDFRLDRVRSTLLLGNSSQVAAVALESGFHHLSRFALAYRRRFGEPPSTTVRRVNNTNHPAAVRQ